MSDIRDNRPELLAPAGDMECLRAALDFGADAVYLAGQMFGMRTAPSNFTREELQTAVALAHVRGVRVYITCNTVPRNKEIDLLQTYHDNFGDPEDDVPVETSASEAPPAETNNL